MYKNTGYSLCDIKYEKCCNAALLDIETKFKNHYTSLQLQIELQKEIIDRLWELVTKILLLKSGPRSQMIYPFDITERLEAELLVDFYCNLSKINASNESLRYSLIEAAKSCKKFDDGIRRLDYSTQSTFIEGDCIHKPLFFNIELIQDILVYFQKMLTRFKVLGKCLQPYSLESIDKYKNMLSMKKDKFEEFYKISMWKCCEKV